MKTNPEDVPAIQKYLSALQESLRQIPGIRLEEGLADAHEFLRSEWESIEYGWSFLSEEDLYQHFVHKFGPPDEVAAGYASTSESTRPVAVEDPLATSSLPRGRFIFAKGRVILACIVILFACLTWLFVYRQKLFATASALQEGPVWASRVVSFTPGNPHSVKSNDPASALGPPDFQEKLNENKQNHTWVSLGRGGQLVVEFTDVWLFDGSGPDLKIVELGPLAEPVSVSVSRDGNKWIPVGRAKGAEATFDLAPFVRPDDRFRFVRLIDVGNVRSKDNEWPGADIDAICALHAIKE